MIKIGKKEISNEIKNELKMLEELIREARGLIGKELKNELPELKKNSKKEMEEISPILWERKLVN